MGLNPRIEVHVEHLELDGMEPGDGQALAAALRAGLAAHLGAGLPASWLEQGAIDAIDAGDVAWDRNPATLGARAADAVAARWGR